MKAAGQPVKVFIEKVSRDEDLKRSAGGGLHSGDLGPVPGVESWHRKM